MICASAATGARNNLQLVEAHPCRKSQTKTWDKQLLSAWRRLRFLTRQKCFFANGFFQFPPADQAFHGQPPASYNVFSDHVVFATPSATNGAQCRKYTIAKPQSE